MFRVSKYVLVVLLASAVGVGAFLSPLRNVSAQLPNPDYQQPFAKTEPAQGSQPSKEEANPLSPVMTAGIEGEPAMLVESTYESIEPDETYFSVSLRETNFDQRQQLRRHRIVFTNVSGKNVAWWRLKPGQHIVIRDLQPLVVQLLQHRGHTSLKRAPLSNQVSPRLCYSFSGMFTE